MTRQASAAFGIARHRVSRAGIGAALRQKAHPLLAVAAARSRRERSGGPLPSAMQGASWAEGSGQMCRPFVDCGCPMTRWRRCPRNSPRNASAGSIAIHTCGVHGHDILAAPVCAGQSHCGALHSAATVSLPPRKGFDLNRATYGFTAEMRPRLGHGDRGKARWRDSKWSQVGVRFTTLLLAACKFDQPARCAGHLLDGRVRGRRTKAG